MRIEKVVISILTILFLAGCVKNEDTISVTEDHFVQPILGSIYGIVLDAQSTPLPNVQVTTGSLHTQSDENGAFLFRNIILNKNGQEVFFEKEDFLTSTKTGITIEGESIYMTPVLKTSTQQPFNNIQNGGVIYNENDIKITIPPSALERLGQTYLGDALVQVSISNNQNNNDYLDLKIVRLADNSPRLLLDQHSFQINIYSDAKERLTLSKALTIQLSGAISTYAAFSRNKASADDFHIIENTVDGTFEGKELGIYLFGKPTPYTEVRGRVKSTNTPLGNVEIDVVNPNFIQKVNANTQGFYRTYLPKNTPFTSTVRHLDESEIISRDIFTSNDKINEINLDSDIDVKTISTSLIDCNNEPLNKGYMHIYPNIIIPTDDVGNINITVPHQWDSLRFSTRNHTERKKGNETTIALPNDNIDLATIKVCDGDKGEYIRYNIDGIQAWSNQPIAGVLGNEVQIYVDHPDFQNPNNFQDLFITFPDMGVGTYSLQSAEFYSERGSEVRYAKCTGNCDAELKVEIQSWGNKVGDIVMGKISGKVQTSTPGVDYDVNAEFNIIRSF